jgi:hypothetical protein
VTADQVNFGQKVGLKPIPRGFIVETDDVVKAAFSG